MYRVIAATIVVCAAPTGTANAEEMPAGIRKQIEESYIGSWNFRMESETGVVEGTFSATWAPGKHCVLIDQISHGPQVKIHNSGILAWEPDTQSVVHHGFLTNGDYFKITYDTFSGNKWAGKVSGVVNGERPGDSEAFVIWKGDSIQYKDSIFDFKASRTKRPHDTWMKFIVGKWSAKASDGRGWEVSIKPLHDGTSLFVDVTNTDGTTGAGIIGWEPDTRRLVETGYGSAGSYWRLIYTEISETELKGKRISRTPDGQTAKGDWHVWREGDDKILWKFVGKTSEGKPIEIRGGHERRE